MPVPWSAQHARASDRARRPLPVTTVCGGAAQRPQGRSPPGYRVACVRVALLALCAVLLEVGWLALWPISVALSHSARFTAAYLEEHPLAQMPLSWGRALLPGVPSAPLAEPLGAAGYVAPATALALLMLGLAVVYVLALVLLARGAGRLPLAIWIVAVGALVFQATCLLLPGLFSQDVFSYIAYGRLAAVHNLNPYVWPPSVVPRDPSLAWVAHAWQSYASPYGPLWVDVQAGMARLTADLSIADQALAYRALANALLLANLGLLWALAGRLTRLDRAQRVTALAARAWNPLTLFEVAGNAHNDVLMVSFTLLGLLLLARSGSGLLSSASLTLGALVKYLSGIGLVWLCAAVAARATGWQARLTRAAMVVLVGSVLLLALSAQWLELPDSLTPLVDETAGAGYVNSLPDSLARLVADRLAAPLELTRTLERLLVLGGVLVYVVWEWRRVWSDATAAAVARALCRSTLVYVLAVSTSVQTWYFCLPVSVAVALGCRWRWAQLALAYSALALPALYLSYYLRAATPWWVYVAYGLIPLAVLVPGLVRARARAHVPAAELIGDEEQPGSPTGPRRGTSGVSSQV